jgi:hypothetical protein
VQSLEIDGNSISDTVSSVSYAYAADCSSVHRQDEEPDAVAGQMLKEREKKALSDLTGAF